MEKVTYTPAEGHQILSNMLTGFLSVATDFIVFQFHISQHQVKKEIWYAVTVYLSPSMHQVLGLFFANKFVWQTCSVDNFCHLF